MGCLNVKIQGVSGCQTEFSHVGGMIANYTNKNGVESEYTRIDGMDAKYERKGGLKVNLYFVCRVGTREFIRVSPEEPIWITMDEMGVYTVRSNTDWVVL